jgi:thiol-disulfide isomerase/thioredoxin
MPLNRKLAVAGVVIAILALLWLSVYSRRDTGEGDIAAPAPALQGYEPAAEPKPLQALAFTDGKGRAMSLADFRGKVVVLNLWATWCTPCLAEMPMLDRLQDELRNEDVVVLALSIDRGGSDVVQAFYTENGIRHLDVYVDRTMWAPDRIRTSGLPTTVLIDREGRERGRVKGPAEWDSPAAVALVRKLAAER